MARISKRDAETGLEYFLLSTGDVPNRKYYFSMASWTTDDCWLMYHRDYPDREDLYIVNTDTGEDVLLAADAKGFGAARGKDVGYYMRGSRLIELDILSGASRPVAELERSPAPVGGHYTVSRSGLVVNTYQQWNGIYALIVTNPVTGKSDIIHQSDTRLGHCQFCPGDDDTIFFCHETGGDALQRMWMASYSQRTVRPFYEESEGDWITHEAWDDRGAELSFIRWPHAILSGTKDGAHFRVVMPGEYHHAAANAELSEYTADRTSAGQILLIDPKARRERVLLTRQFARVGPDHCHPSFNRAGDKISFSLPGEGVCQVGYMDLNQVR